MPDFISDYVRALDKRFQTGNAQEHSYRGDLQQLFEQMMTGVQAINEPKHIQCGAPDYMITRSGISVGFVEAKDVDKDLDDKNFNEQFGRYRKSLDNLIITNYLEFRFYRDGQEIAKVRIARLDSGRIRENADERERFVQLMSAFEQTGGLSIKSAEKLAELMAGKAALLADIIKHALKEDNAGYENKSLREQFAAFQRILIATITPDEFADVYAQTITYGLFAGRLNALSSADFSRTAAGSCIPRKNIFLRKLFNYIAGNEIDDRIKWIVDDLARVFAAADLQSILQSYGKATATRDPLIHFYETFLNKYDPKQRKLRGVWYTPQPVVNFIVRATDDILKNDFSLADGLADDSKFTRLVTDSKYGDKKTGARSATVQKSDFRVQILDPATGTGTFLAEIIRQVYEKFAGNLGLWQGYAEEKLLPRLHGFELLMASYAMAHLKLDRILAETGFQAKNDNRLQVYLTDSLEEAHPDAGTMFATWLSDESMEAAQIKRDAPIMVVLGNPPYNGESQNNGTWIKNLIEVYKREPDGGALRERNPKWLNDDYVKFIRYAEDYVERNTIGVVAYINNHSFLDNPTFRGMRAHLLRTFDKIYILDLHGNYKKKETCPDGSPDENVFDIQQGVSINLFIKTGQKKTGALAAVYHADLFGKRESKYAFLSEKSLSDIDFRLIENAAPYYFFVPKDFSLSKEYEKGFALNDLFPGNSVGIVTADDKTLIDMKSENLKGKTERKYAVRFDAEKVQKIAYRPFDDRFIYFDKELIERPREEIMKHFIGRENLGLVVSKQVKAFDDYHHVAVVKNIFESSFVSNKTSEITYGFPLYLYDPVDGAQRINFDSAVFAKIRKKAGADVAAIDVFDYVLAVLHSPDYRKKYKEFLKIDFPKIPYPESKKQFAERAAIGARIRQILLLEDIAPNTVGYPVAGNNAVEALRFEEGRVYINQTQYFAPVPREVWDFFVGGYQPAQKWLKDRKGRTLGYDDIRHYQKIIAALIQINQIMQKITV